MGKVSGVIKAMGLSMGQHQRRRILELDKEFESLERKVVDLEAEKLQLQARVNPLRREVEQLKKQLDPAFTFDKKIGAYLDARNGLYCCAKCHHEDRGRVPMKEGPGGWICKVCSKQYPNPSAPRATVKTRPAGRNFVRDWRP